MMSGEYFLTEEQKAEKEAMNKREKKASKKLERVEKQAALLKAPEEDTVGVKK